MARPPAGVSTTHSADVPPAAHGVASLSQLTCVEVLEDSFAVVRTDRSPGGFTVYKVTYKAKTTSQDGVPIIQEFVAWKRFSDFQHLSKQLELEHSLSKSRVKFPSLVKAKYFERFKEAVIEERKRSAEELLQFATHFCHLVLSPPLQLFIAESKPTKRTYPADPTTTGDASSVEPTPSPTFDSNTLTYTHTISVSEEEQLAVGSILANFESGSTKVENKTRKNGGEALKDIRITEKTDEVDRDTVSEMSSSPLPMDQDAITATESGSGELLAVPEVGTTLSSGTSSKSGSNVSLENVELEADISELESTNLTEESVSVTEWNVTHSLKLRDGEKTVAQIDKKNEAEEENESSEVSGSPDENLKVEVVDSNSGMFSGKEGGEKAEDKGTGGNTGGGMSWWADAMAESQNEIDNLDALVEECKDGDASRTKDSSTPDQPIQSLNGQTKGATVKQPSNGSVDKAASESKFDESKKLGRMSGRSSTDSINSIGKNKSTGSRRGSRQSSRSPSPSQRRSSLSVKDKAAYVIQAGRLISQALEFERKEEYEEAFDLFKAGVDVLLNGVQTDSNKKRREIVRKKTSEYLKHAEDLFQEYLITKSTSPTEPPTSQEPNVKAQPSPPSGKPHNLPDFKVLSLIGKVMLVESRHTGQKYIFKVLHKSLQVMSAAGKGVSKATINRSPQQCPHMVRLLHHYPTLNHRIFLLLEYQKRGKLIEFVTAKREQWRKLREAASNPPVSSNLLVNHQGSSDKLTEDREPANDEGTSKETSKDKEEELDDQEMERMLNELTSIVPPSNSLPVTSSLTSQEGGEEGVGSDEDSLDSLALMRKRLEETVESRSDTENDDEVLSSLSRNHPAVSKEKDESERPSGSQSSGASITIEPPTPTDVAQNPLGIDGEEHSKRTADKERLNVGRAKSTSDSQSENLEASLPSTKVAAPKHSPSIDVPQRRSSKDVTDGTVTMSSGSPGRASSKQGSPCFSPASMHNSPNVSNKVDDWMLRLEDKLRQWSAQIILALEHLHNHGILCRDLNCENVLLDDSGSAVLTYFGKWDFVEQQTKYELVKDLYVAPELQGLTEATIAADWWSLGAVLFEILTGKSLISCHPCGVHSHLPLRVPVTLSPEAQSLLTQLLQVNPNERLGSGMDGVEEIKAHPFFANVDWSSL